jgi:hypothetical protein
LFRVGRAFGTTKMFNYENRQMAYAPHTSASDFKVFTSINHVRFAHSWVDKKQINTFFQQKEELLWKSELGK